jgi:4-amino-4-deoxy-L-arabinose transferase-like glycosyltransferase
MFALAAILAFLFFSQGIRAPFEKDEESRPAGIVRDVVQHGDWLVPRDDYGEASRKPPLFYWLTAVAAGATGGRVDEARSRAISLLAAVAIAIEVMSFSASYLGESAGWLAMTFLFGIYGFSSRAGHARTDMLFSALLFSAWYALYAQIEQRPTRGRTLLIGALLGFAILTKGPLALVLCAVAIVGYLLLRRRNPIDLVRIGWPWQAAGLAFAIAALWYVPAFLHDRSLLAVQFGEENLGHMMPSGWGGTGEAARPVYYILARMLGAALPLSLYIPALALALRNGELWGEARKPIIYQLSIVLAVLAMFSVASAKRDIYILPALPSLAILFAGLFAVAPRIASSARILWIVAGGIIATAAVALVVGAVAIGFGATIPGRFTRGMQSSDAAYAALVVDGIRSWRWRFVIFDVAAAFAAAAFAISGAARRPRWAAMGVALMSMAGVSLWIGTLRPELMSGRTLREFAVQTRGIVNQRPIYILGGIDYELSFYLNRGVPVWTPSKVEAVADAPVYLVGSSDEVDRLAPERKASLKPLMRSQCPLRRRQMLLFETVEPPRK